MVVVDASVIFKWFTKEPDSNPALKLLKDHKSQKSIIYIPDLAIYELANAWVTKTILSVLEVKDNLDKLQEAGLQIEPVNFEQANKAVDLAKQYKLSVYDAYYLTLAKIKRCSLITADSKLVDKVALPFVRMLK